MRNRFSCHTSQSIWVDLRKIEGGQPGRRRKKRGRRSRAANREPIMNVPQCPCLVLMYSTRQIDWTYQRANQSWSATVRNRSDLEGEAEREAEERSRAANCKPIMDVPQRPCSVMMYSTRQIDWTYQRVNQSWSGKVRIGSALEAEEEEVEEE